MTTSSPCSFPMIMKVTNTITWVYILPDTFLCFYLHTSVSAKNYKWLDLFYQMILYFMCYFEICPFHMLIRLGVFTPTDIDLSNSNHLLHTIPSSECAIVLPFSYTHCSFHSRVYEGHSEHLQIGFLVHVCFSRVNKT